MFTTLIATDDDTERRSVVRPAQPTSAVKPSPDFYIVAPRSEHSMEPTVYALSTAPLAPFLDWLGDVVHAERKHSLLLSVLIRGFDAKQSIKLLDEHGVDMSKYLYGSEAEAAKAMYDALNEGSEVGNA